MSNIGRHLVLRGSAAVIAALAVGYSVNASAVEVLTDRCSQEVAIVPYYNANPTTTGTVILRRRADGYTDWVDVNVSLGSSGHIRWWCHSTAGNWFDVGTWRINELVVGSVCTNDNTGQFICRPNVNIKLGSSAWQGWTPERSRCDDRSTRLRVRLGPNRLLQMLCMGR